MDSQPWLQFRLATDGASRLHKVREAMFAGTFFETEDCWFHASMLDSAAVFVVRHNWAAVLGAAVGETDEYRLPFDLCAFEFRVDGIPIALFARPAGERHESAFLFQARDGSWNGTGAGAQGNVARMKAFCDAQVRAICVALEAKVADRQLVKAPAALNAKRARTGKPPLFDYHVVDLARRLQSAPADGGGTSGKQVRLHFRRGHWRHYDETHKTWIEWTLVGNPDLGWVDKEYRI